jgi:hypothetical protein
VTKSRDSTPARLELDSRTAAVVTVAWVVVMNKPFYPFYVWWFVGGGFPATLTALIGTPFYAAVPFLARRAPFAARVALPVIGTLDSMLATKVFGRGSGTELFLFACAALAALSFRSDEAWPSRGLTAMIFLGFVAVHDFAGGALHDLPPEQLRRLLELNIFSAAALVAFIGLRFAGVART